MAGQPEPVTELRAVCHRAVRRIHVHIERPWHAVVRGDDHRVLALRVGQTVVDGGDLVGDVRSADTVRAYIVHAVDVRRVDAIGKPDWNDQEEDRLGLEQVTRATRYIKALP